METATESKPWFSNETKLGLGLAAGALGTIGIFALAIKLDKGSKSSKPMAVVSETPVRGVVGGEGQGQVVNMKTLQVTLSMEVPETFGRREIDALLARLKVVTDPSARYLGVDAFGERWGSPQAPRVRAVPADIYT